MGKINTERKFSKKIYEHFFQITLCLHKENSLISDSLKRRKLEEKLLKYG